MDEVQELKDLREQCGFYRSRVIMLIEQSLGEIEKNYKTPNWITTPITRFDGYLRCANDANLLSRRESVEFSERLDVVRQWFEERV